ncbi:hypothetical protein PDN46_07140 [Bacillus cereus group sp. Bc191]|uniref:Uncharacterized protein n=1 Tax=Bacillus paranthracis TaxID=2026186 RepID=A0AAX3QF39_9BACI|nr:MULTISPECIES: hypothetical protein [Bacillus cereus group]MDA2288148.1 hypothetical protein [Bacillus cereus group sp. Bc191]WES07872.1 hypothetical protein P3K65_05255 [Bacillus paranthracis]
MRFNKYTVMLMFLTIGSNAALSMWLKQGLLGVYHGYCSLVNCCMDYKGSHTDGQHK